MKFWDDMNTKYGFGDGNCYPDGIELYREVYIKTINRLAEKLGSRCRVVPYDRPGVHNFCLRFFVSKEWFDEIYATREKEKGLLPSVTHEDFKTAPSAFDVETDDEMLEAISAAEELYVDQYLDVTVKISPCFETFLQNCEQEMQALELSI